MRAFVQIAALFVVAAVAGAGHSASARDCNEWNARYVSHADEAGGRTVAVFGAPQGTEPQPFVLRGVDGSGATVWEFATVAWCFQGAGGCHMDLKLTDGAAVSGETDNPIRLVFAQSSKDRPGAVPDILVIAGLNTAFLEAQTTNGPWRLALSKAPPEDDLAIPPEVYYFDRCVGD